MSFPGIPTSMTMNDLEPKNRGFSVFFAISGCDAHLEAIVAKITGDRPGQPAYKIELMLSRVSCALAQISCYIYHRASFPSAALFMQAEMIQQDHKLLKIN